MKQTMTFIVLMSVTVAAQADDWPQWRGPGRDSVWREDGLLEKFSAKGPNVVWRTPVAGGYAGPAVAESRVVVTDYVTGENVKIANFERKSFTGVERVLCLDEATGQPQWKHEYPVKYAISYPSGPRCTPVINEGKAYTLGAEGNLFCFDLDSGEIAWSKDLCADYKTKTALWGYASHPLIDGQKLICVVGGAGSHVVAFDKESGAELWRGLTSPEQGYSPPTIITAGGTRQLVLLRPDAVTAVDPETGDEYWSVPYEATSGSIIMSPVQWQDYLYVGGYSNKNLLLKLAADRPDAEVVWQDKPKHGISPVNVQPLIDEGTLYGFDQSGWMYAVALPSGERLWQTSAPIGEHAVQTGTAFLVKQADRFWMFNENGELLIAKLTPAAFQEVDRCQVLKPTNVAFGRNVVWSVPAFANRRMFARNDEECVCVDLAAE